MSRIPYCLTVASFRQPSPMKLLLIEDDASMQAALQRALSRRGIEVTVQRDDGQRVTVAQPDDGEIQMGDRVAIVYDRNGVARVVRDNGYRRD